MYQKNWFNQTTFTTASWSLKIHVFTSCAFSEHKRQLCQFGRTCLLHTELQLIELFMATCVIMSIEYPIYTTYKKTTWPLQWQWTSNQQFVLQVVTLTCYSLTFNVAFFLSGKRLQWDSTTLFLLFATPLPSNRHHRSSGDCLEGKGENYQVCSVQYCVQQLCTVRCTHI